MNRIHKLDIVTSARNEEANLELLFQRLEKSLLSRDLKWRLIICDNNSQDRSWEIIEGLASKDSRVLGLKMSRDFGFEGAIAAALSKTNADAVVMMASDLQDPPEYIPKLIDVFESGYDHVFQIVKKRPGSSVLRRVNSWLFYKVAFRLSKGLIRPGSSIFRIMSQPMVLQLNQMQERNRFIRALVMYLGFRSTGIEIPREARPGGESKANTRHVLGLALKGILSNSYGLLDLVGYLGLGLSALAILSTFVFATIWLTVGVPFAGFGLIVGILLLGFALLFLALGIISQYLSLIYEEVKGRPNFVIMKTTDELG